MAMNPVRGMYRSPSTTGQQITDARNAYRQRAATGIYSPIDSVRNAAIMAQPGYMDQWNARAADALARQQAASRVSEGLSNMNAVRRLPPDFAASQAANTLPQQLPQDPTQWASWQYLGDPARKQLLASLQQRTQPPSPFWQNENPTLRAIGPRPSDQYANDPAARQNMSLQAIRAGNVQGPSQRAMSVANPNAAFRRTGMPVMMARGYGR